MLEKRVTVRIPQTMYIAVKKVAKRNGVADSVVLRSALFYLCKRYCGKGANYSQCAQAIISDINNLPFSKRKYLEQYAGARPTFRLGPSVFNCIESIADNAGVPKSLLVRYALLIWPETSRYLP